MPPIVRLKDVVDELNVSDEVFELYLDRRTGKIVTVQTAEGDEISGEAQDDPEGGFRAGEAAREDVWLAVTNGDLIPLPSEEDIHEWEIMRDFAETREEPLRETLLDTVHGGGAFRRFKSAVDRAGVREAWFKYRDQRIEKIVIEWLDEEGIAWTR